MKGSGRVYSRRLPACPGNWPRVGNTARITCPGTQAPPSVFKTSSPHHTAPRHYGGKRIAACFSCTRHREPRAFLVHPHWFAGCGMLVAGGFCYRMLVDESYIARESQNSPAPARASDRLLSIRVHEKHDIVSFFLGKRSLLVVTRPSGPGAMQPAASVRGCPCPESRRC